MDKKNLAITILGTLSAITLTGSIVLLWQTSLRTQQVSTLEQDIAGLTRERDSLRQQVRTLENEVAQADAQQQKLQATVTDLTQQIAASAARKSTMCLKNNACKFSPPGSYNFRCNDRGVFSTTGANWCTCNDECEVDIATGP